MLLPPQMLRADALPPDQPVNLPEETLRHTLAAGRPALRLSQIYMACPFLFSRQVLPQEDVEVALPYQKVKRIVETSGIPVESLGAPAPQGASPFQRAALGTVASPFARAMPDVEMSAKAPLSAAPVAALQPSMNSPFAAVSAPNSPFPQSGIPQTSLPSSLGRPAGPPAAASPFSFAVSAVAASDEPTQSMPSPFAAAPSLAAPAPLPVFAPPVAELTPAPTLPPMAPVASMAPVVPFPRMIDEIPEAIVAPLSAPAFSAPPPSVPVPPAPPVMPVVPAPVEAKSCNFPCANSCAMVPKTS
jgi:hypothetical protein